MYHIAKFFRWLKWLKNGKPCVSYPGFHCGLCGAWAGEEFSIPKYQSCGKWWDTWGVCDDCKKPAFTRDEFYAAYAARMSWPEYEMWTEHDVREMGKLALPCHCDAPMCGGWKMVDVSCMTQWEVDQLPEKYKREVIERRSAEVAEIKRRGLWTTEVVEFV